MKKLRNILIDSIIALALLLQVLYLNSNPNLLFATLLIYNIIVLSIHKSKSLLKLFIFTAIFGALSEIVSIYYGAWSYATPQFLGIPYWLPLVWGHAGIYMHRVGKYLSK